jgi:hypothetical protein
MARMLYLLMAILVVMGSLFLCAVCAYWLKAADLLAGLGFVVWVFPLLTARWLAKRYLERFGLRPGEIE